MNIAESGRHSQLHDRTVLLIDDGLATGASMRAAVAGVRAQSPARIVVAVPTAASETCEALEPEVDELFVSPRRSHFTASVVGTKISLKRRMKRCGNTWKRQLTHCR